MRIQLTATIKLYKSQLDKEILLTEGEQAMLKNSNLIRVSLIDDSLEEQIGSSVQAKLDCLKKFQSGKNTWDTVLFPVKAGGVGKSLQPKKKHVKRTKKS